MSDAGPVKSITAYEMIREMILTGEALPGTRLVLSELEAKLGVGRGPVRDALMRLDRSGLVQNLPYKGAVVTIPPSYKEMEHMYALRITAELILAKEALENITEKDIAHLESIANEMMNDIENPMSFTKDREFHSYLYSIAKMNHLQAIVENIFDYVGIFLNFHRYEQKDKELFHAQHIIMLQAIKEKNHDLLCKTLKKNIDVGLVVIRNKFMKN